MDAREEVFAAIFEAHYGPVLAFLMRRGCPREDARDLTQETFLRAYRSIDSFRGEANLRTWILKISANVWKNELRRRHTSKRDGDTRSLESTGSGAEGLFELSRHEEEEGVPDPRWVAQLATTEQGPLEVALDEERRRLLQGAIVELPARMRRCLLLRAAGLSYGEIAATLNISVATVGSQIAEEKSRLKAKLGRSAAIEVSPPDTDSAFQSAAVGRDTREPRLIEERQRLLQSSFAEFSAQMRRCVLLRLEGLSVKETAEAMNLHAATVRSHLEKAESHLREKLGSREE
jgi:RNA polymerase sigma-70 factor, ECF subfamily